MYREKNYKLSNVSDLVKIKPKHANSKIKFLSREIKNTTKYLRSLHIYNCLVAPATLKLTLTLTENPNLTVGARAIFLGGNCPDTHYTIVVINYTVGAIDSFMIRLCGES